MEKNID